MPVITDEGVTVLSRQLSCHLVPQVRGDTRLVSRFGETVAADALHSFFGCALIVTDGAI